MIYLIAFPLMFIFILLPIKSFSIASPVLNKDVLTKTKNTLKTSISTKENIKAQGEQKKTKPFFAIQLKGEGRLSKDQISKNLPEFYPSIPWTELEFYYSKNKNMDFLINFEVESRHKEWSIGLDEFSFSYAFEHIPFSVQVGWLPAPLGYRDKNTHVFSKELSLYNSITLNHEDIAWSVRTQILPSSALFFQVDYLSGWSYREWDNSYNQPDSTPFIVSLKSQGFFWDLFISWFEEDLAFFDPVQAIGAGINLNTSYKKLTVVFQSEFWWITKDQQTSFAYYVFPHIAIGPLKVGMIFESINHFSPNYEKAQARSSIYERAFQVSWQIHPNMVIIGERFISTQKKGPLLHDLWALRVQGHFGWSTLR